jgi:tetratricopeptide (TPR) repeat protein
MWIRILLILLTIFSPLSLFSSDDDEDEWEDECESALVSYGGIEFICPYGCGDLNCSLELQTIYYLGCSCLRKPLYRFSHHRCKENYYIDNFDLHEWNKEDLYLFAGLDHKESQEILRNYFDFEEEDISSYTWFLDKTSLFRKALDQSRLESKKAEEECLQNIKHILNLKAQGAQFVKYKYIEGKIEGYECSSCRFDETVEDALKTQQRVITLRKEEQKKCDEFQEYAEHIFRQIDSLYYDIFEWCLENHQPEGIEFHAVIESLLVGDSLEGINHLRNLLKIAEENGYDKQVISKIQFLKGQLESESLLYGDALVSLTEAIANMPSLKEAYLERAAAYFELGEFDLSLQDYLQSEIKPINIESLELISFSLGLTEGLVQGGTQASIEFIPSLLSSLQGISQSLWALIQNPIQTSSEFIHAAYACVEFIKDHTSEQIFSELAPELKQLITNWNIFDDRKKGEITGQIIGKYGIELFAGGSLVKGIKIYRELRKANNLLVFETIALSERHKKIIKANSLKKLKTRQEMLSRANLKVEIDKQSKHILQHKNFQSGRSIFQHSNPQELIYKFAGTGIKDSKQFAGSPGYKEIVNFGEFIGYYIDQTTGKSISTNWGKIHYSKNGVHIVPTSPRN